MIKNSAQLTDITILAGQTQSRIVIGPNEYNDAEQLIFYAPAVLAEAVVIQVNRNPLALAGDANWVTLQVVIGAALADAASPVAGKARGFGSELCGTMAFRFVAGAAVAADRTFQCTKHWST